MENVNQEMKQYLEENAAATEKALAGYLAGEDADLNRIFEAQRYSLLGGGKRIRPFLVNTCCKTLGGNAEVSMPYACALEMIHTYSLIHDDLPCMDDDDLRRGKPTNHKKFGESTAVLAGDALLTRAFGVAASNPFADSAANNMAVRILSDAAGDRGMIGGQVIDLEGEHTRLELEKLLRLHHLKTGALIRCAVLLGCLAAGYMPDTPEAKAMEEYADKVGLCFQVIDDIFDVSGTPELLGKNVGSDAGHHKTTFMAYFTEAEARAYAERCTAEAVSAISELKNSELLTDFAVFLLNRKY